MRTRKTPVKHVVRSHNRQSKKVQAYVRGRGQKNVNIASPMLHVSTQHENELKQLAVETVSDNYWSYQMGLEAEGQDEDIYNDFDDELVDVLEHDKVPQQDIDFIMNFVNTPEFWKKFYKEVPDAKGLIMY